MNVRKLTLLTVILLLSVVLTGGILTTAQTQEPDLQKGLVAYWSFDEREGDIVFDESGNHNDGVLKCAGEDCSPPTWVEGKKGYALEFDGVDDYVEIQNSPTISLTGNFTLAAWIYGKKWKGDQRNILSKGGNDSYRWRIEKKGTLWLLLNDGEGINVYRYRDVHLNLTQWKYLLVTVNLNRGEIKFYVDGTLVNVQSTQISKVAVKKTPLYIGAYTPGKEIFNGKIDEVQVYDKVLSEAQVAQLFEQGE